MSALAQLLDEPNLRRLAGDHCAAHGRQRTHGRQRNLIKILSEPE